MKDKDKTNDNKIIYIQNYFKKKNKSLKNKPVATSETESSAMDQVNVSPVSSNVIDIGYYLRTKKLNKEKQKNNLTDNQENKLGKVISFSQRKRNRTEEQPTKKLSDLKQGQSSVIFLKDYLKRKNLNPVPFEQKSQEKKEMTMKSYQSIGMVAAALLAIFSTSLFYQQSEMRGLASVEESGISLEEMGSLSYKIDRTPQSFKEEGLSASEYVKHLRRTQNSIKARGEKPSVSDYTNY